MKFDLVIFLTALSLFVSNAHSETFTIEYCANIELQIHTIETLDQSGNNNALTNSIESLITARYYRDLGICKMKGISGDKDVSTAKKLLSRAVELGDPTAPEIFASLLVFLSPDVSDHRNGILYFEKAYKDGSKFAAGKLGWAYHLGKGVIANDRKALILYEEAATAGMTLWQYLLAHVYEQGYYGAEPDMAKKRYWIEYQPKIHTYIYECAIYELYAADSSFPPDKRLEDQFLKSCQALSSRD